MWSVLGNASLDESSKKPRQPQRRRPLPQPPAASPHDTKHNNGRRPNPPATTTATSKRARPSGTSAAAAASAAPMCGKHRITGTMRKGATGYLYSAVASAVQDGNGEKEAAAGVGGLGGAGDGVVLKVEECAAPKRQMQNEWAVSAKGLGSMFLWRCGGVFITRGGGRVDAPRPSWILDVLCMNQVLVGWKEGRSSTAAVKGRSSTAGNS